MYPIGLTCASVKWVCSLQRFRPRNASRYIERQGPFFRDDHYPRILSQTAVLGPELLLRDSIVVDFARDQSPHSLV